MTRCEFVVQDFRRFTVRNEKKTIEPLEVALDFFFQNICLDTRSRMHKRTGSGAANLK